MRVLFVFNHPAPYKIRLFNKLSEKIDLTALFERSFNADRNPLFYKEGTPKFKIVTIKGVPLGNESHLSTGIVKHLKNNSYDLIIMNGWHTFSEMLALRYLKKQCKSYVFYINGGIIDAKETRFVRKIKTYFISGAKAYMSPDANSNAYLVHYGAKADTIENYPYATIYEHDILNSPLTQNDKSIIRNELGIEAKKLFVACGQFIKRKNHSRLINYWQQAPKDDVLLLIGGGKDKRLYERLIAKNQLKNVRLINYLPKDELFKYFRAADACLFPTNEDIYGHVVNEAFSQGLPVIASRHANSALNLIKDGFNGHLIDFEDDKQISNSIQNIINTPKMSTSALATARENTIEIMAQRHLEIFAQWTKNK